VQTTVNNSLGASPGTLERYKRLRLVKVLVLCGLGACAAGIALFALTLGPLDLTPAQVGSALVHRILPGTFPGPGDLAQRTIWFMRLPRILTGLVAGFNLGIAGAVMQPVLRNPMASPFTLGISSGAGFGAALAILFGQTGPWGVYTTVASAFGFSLLSAFVILGLSGKKGGVPQDMILTGIALSYLFQAGTTVMQYFSDSWAVTEIVFWMVGTLSKSTWGSLGIMACAAGVCVPFILPASAHLNVMSAGDEVSQSSGVRVARTRVALLTAASLLTAATICFTGTIGFIGLVAPHICRMILGSDNRFVLPASGIMGGALLCSADTAAMHMMAPVVIPIGVMTAFIGVPLFVYLIMKNRSRFWH